MSHPLSLDHIRRRMAAHRAESFAGEQVARRAAVAAILRPQPGRPEATDVLLIRRAERQGDPWSGHMAFPGGHAEPQDPDLLATARRETHEEVGLDLSGHELMGRLDDHPVTARGRFMGMVISPYVFALQGDARFAPNHEVAGVLWAPLDQMLSGENDAVKEYTHEGQPMRLPAYDVDGNVVWGLTHRMLQNFFDTLRQS